MNSPNNKLALGTVQFGIDYGVTNQLGKVLPNEVASILRIASENGIDLLDSASTYGDAQRVLGEVLSEQGLTKNFQLVSKVHLTSSKDVKGQVYSQVDQTLCDLKGAQLHSLMVHHGSQIRSMSKDLLPVLSDLRGDFPSLKIGASFYSPNDYEQVLEATSLDVIQIPYNVFNQDFASLLSSNDSRPEVHARSIFLQGILLTPQSSRPAYFAQFENEFSKYDEVLKKEQLSPIQYNLSFALAQNWIDRIVVGVTNGKELEEIFKALDTKPNINHADLASTNIQLTNPSNWKI